MQGLKQLSSYRRIVVKIGSSLLVHPSKGLKHVWLASIAADIAALKAAGVEILVVSSGAIALGRALLGVNQASLKLAHAQALAAIGQIELGRAYADCLASHHLRAAQILLTLSDTERRRSYLNARATINTVLELGALPVINENDTVATSEIRYGDNDRLAARVATMMQADLLILLSDIDGLYSAPPHLDTQAYLFPIIRAITPEIEAMAGGAASVLSRGGMRTKIEAGKIATSAGTAMLIASGKKLHPLRLIDEGAPSSFFCASTKPVSAWKRWIAGNIEPAGILYIDDGAVQALKRGKSLLPAGVCSIFGHFERGDTVSVFNLEGQEVARGLIAYDEREARAIAGYKSDEIAATLGYDGRGAMIHRNDMVLR